MPQILDQVRPALRKAGRFFFFQKRTCDLSSDEPTEHRDFELLFESECGYRLVKGGSS